MWAICWRSWSCVRGRGGRVCEFVWGRGGCCGGEGGMDREGREGMDWEAVGWDNDGDSLVSRGSRILAEVVVAMSDIHTSL